MNAKYINICIAYWQVGKYTSTTAYTLFYQNNLLSKYQHQDIHGLQKSKKYISCILTVNKYFENVLKINSLYEQNFL
jgi:hypothetical protein